MREFWHGTGIVPVLIASPDDIGRASAFWS